MTIGKSRVSDYSVPGDLIKKKPYVYRILQPSEILYAQQGMGWNRGSISRELTISDFRLIIRNLFSDSCILTLAL